MVGSMYSADLIFINILTSCHGMPRTTRMAIEIAQLIMEIDDSIPKQDQPRNVGISSLRHFGVFHGCCDGNVLHAPCICDGWNQTNRLEPISPEPKWIRKHIRKI